MALEGTCDAGFDGVGQCFQEHLETGADLGASVAVWSEGRLVVDLWGGWADAGKTTPWAEDTITAVWSTTKALTSLCAHILVDRGVLDLDAPVAEVWPEFAAGGKGDIPLRWLLSHRAGLSGFAEKIDAEELTDWDLVVGRLAAQEPIWEPGTAIGYGPITFGHLVGEVIRRVSGMSPGAFLSAEVAEPLDVPATLGIGSAAREQIAELIPPQVTADSPLISIAMRTHPAAVAAMRYPAMRGDEPNRSSWRAAEIPAVNAYTNARALATIFGKLADGSHPFMSRATLETAITSQGADVDLVTDVRTDYGLGFRVYPSSLGGTAVAFGHDGFGGSTLHVEPERGLAFAYVPNRMGAYLYDDPRKVRLLAAVAQGASQAQPSARVG